MTETTTGVSERTAAAAQRLIARYPVSRSALLPLLHLVQSEHGYVSEDGIAFCARALALTKAEVAAVATFYTMFKRTPVGDWLLSVCTNPTCKIKGGQAIHDRYLDALGGHHDPDAGVTVEHAECLGICDAAPVVQVNYEMYGPLTAEEADELLVACRQGSPPPSNWSNDVPGTFRDVEWDLSGAADGLDAELASAAMAQVRSDVPPAQRSGETDIPVTHPGGDPTGHGGRLHAEQAGRTPPPGRDRGADAVTGGPSGDEPPEGTGYASEDEQPAGGPTPSTADYPEQPSEGDQPPESTGEQATQTDEGVAAGVPQADDDSTQGDGGL